MRSERTTLFCLLFVPILILGLPAPPGLAVVKYSYYNGGQQIWISVDSFNARSQLNYPGYDFVEDAIAQSVGPLSGTAYYFPLIAGDPASSPTVFMNAWVEYQISPADLPDDIAVNLNGTNWYFWARCTTLDDAASTNYNKDSNWLIVDGDPGDLTLVPPPPPTDDQWYAADSILNPPTATERRTTDRVCNDVWLQGARVTAGPPAAGTWTWVGHSNSGGDASPRVKQLRLIDNRVTFRLYEAEASPWSARIDVICWANTPYTGAPMPNYAPTDTDYLNATQKILCSVQHNTTSASPASHENTADTTLTVTGGHLEVVTGARLVRDGGGGSDIVATAIHVGAGPDETTMTADFPTTGVLPGTYSLITEQDPPCMARTLPGVVRLAHRVYVKADATGVNDGTNWADAYRELQSALATAPFGSEIWVAKGTYKPDYDLSTRTHTGNRSAAFQLRSGVSIYGGFLGNEIPAEFDLTARDFAVHETVLSGDLNGDDGPDFASNGDNSYHVGQATNVDSTAVLDGFTVRGGNANGIQLDNNGGGLRLDASSPMIAHCIFIGNTCTENGAVSRVGLGAPTFLKCAFIGNLDSGSDVTGAVFAYDSHTSFINCVFSGNRALGGGATITDYGWSSVVNCTFAGNLGSIAGGIAASQGTTIRNCILWGNLPSQQIYVPFWSQVIVSYCCVENGWPGEGNTAVSPHFVNANGPDQVFGTSDDNLRLVVGSPCIDAGTNAVSAVLPTTDLDGASRIVNGIVDMGAYEFDPLRDTDDDGVPDPLDNCPNVPNSDQADSDSNGVGDPCDHRRYVKADATGLNNGSSWVNAYRELQSALTIAVTGDEIWVAAGIYRPDYDLSIQAHTGDRSAAFYLKSGVSIYGGFAGNEIPGAFDLNARDFDAHETVLSGDLNGDDGSDFVSNGDNSYHVIRAINVGDVAVLDGFTIRGGNASGLDPHDAGGGLRLDSSSVTVASCTISNNSSSGNAGGLLANAGNVAVANVVFAMNRAGSRGGAVWADNCSPKLVNCVLRHNIATQGAGIGCGVSCTPMVTNCTLYGNSASLAGGGAYGSGVMQNCVVWGNTAVDGPQLAGSPMVRFSCVQGGFDGSGNTAIDPLFMDTGSGDLRLSAESLCINAGSNAALPADQGDLDHDGDIAEQTPRDIGRNPRVIADTVDMGAYEADQVLLVSVRRLVVPEGGEATFTVAIGRDPHSAVTVSVARASGDPDITVASGGSLLFDSGNFSTPQTVTLSAAEDADAVSNTAIIAVTATGFSAQYVVAQEADHDLSLWRLCVKSDAGWGGDGQDWTTAFSYLQDALRLASMLPGTGEIWVAMGGYKPDQGGTQTPGNRVATFQLRNGVALYGGFAGNESTRNQRNPAANVTVLSGDLNDDDGPEFINNTENSYHVVNSNGTNSTAVLDGFNVCKGNARYADSRYGHGGGVYNDSGSPMLANCVFSDNSASSFGGGIYSKNGNPTLINCIFNGNSSGSSNYPGGGGGLFDDGGSPTLSNCTFDSNRSYSDGGGIRSIAYGNLTLTNCTFSRNWAAGGGGGMYVKSHSGTLSNCLFSGNTAFGSGGGLVYSSAVLLAMANCSFVGNSAHSYGGGMHMAGPGTLANCMFSGNFTTSAHGGGMHNDGGDPALVSCTFIANSAAGRGGGIHNVSSSPSLVNCVLWGNSALSGSQVYVAYQFSQGMEPRPSELSASHSDIQGGMTEVPVDPQASLVWGTGNIDADPLLTPDGHLRSNSPCLDLGATNGAPGTDRDEEVRPSGAGVDMGADEFLDADGDHLPDWWESRYFGSATTAAASDDPDGDGLTNLQEYEQYSSNPTALPYYVSPAGNDSWNGRFATNQGNGIDGPKQTIQAALELAVDGDTVVVAPGTYRDSGGFELDYGRKSLVVRGSGGSAATTINCGNSGRAVNLESIKGLFAVLEGFTIQNGLADFGGGLRIDQSRLILQDCILQNNAAVPPPNAEGGGLYSNLATPTIRNLIFATGNSASPGKADAGVIRASNVSLEGDLVLQAGRLDVKSSWFDGPGRINVAENGTLRVAGDTANAPPSVIRGQLAGVGNVVVDPGQTLHIAGNGCVDMRHPGEGTPCTDPGGSAGGTITIDGTLLVRDSAQVANTSIRVKQAQITTDQPVQFNDIHLVDSLNSGGQFFVEDVARILSNVITSEGDRYLDLDPDPAAMSHPTIDGNTLRMIIVSHPGSPLGTLLELRARDADCGTSGNPNCQSGAFQLLIGNRFDGEPAQNWVLESLEIKPGAKLNLTNRPGFLFQTGSPYPETVYVKTLKLHPGAVLNTALQTLYYEQLVDENDQVIDSASLPDSTGRKIVDVPLLGFSLGIIAMNDQMASPFNEFDIRIRQRLRDDADQQDCRCDGVCPNNSPPQDTSTCLEGAITHLRDVRAAGDGVMEMKTRADGKQAGSSVAVKGSFARAGEENIVVAFEYQFLNAGDAGDAEIVVKLSDNQNVDVSNYEVARVRPPVAGLPGSVGSSVYAVFYQVVPYEDWSAHLTKLVRGTYVELELRGKGAVVRIDNFDPQVICRFECASYDGVQGVTEADYLVLLSQYGRALTLSDSNGCLDSRLSGDHYVDLADLLAWDSLKSGNLNSCSYGLPLGAPPSPPIEPAGSTVFPSGGLVVTGKPNGAGVQKDSLYTLTPSGTCVSSGVPPAGGSNSRANGRLIRDSKGQVYQLHGMTGLVCLEDRLTVIPPRNDLTCDAKTVHVALTPTGGGNFTGMPVADVAFHPTDATAVYVVPVLVRVPADGHTYRAAAKLRLSTNEAGQYTGQYSVERLYGMNPYTDPMVLPNTPEASPYDVQRLREIEISRDGTRILVSSSQELNGNHWLVIYDEATAAEIRIELDALPTPVQSPVAMLASSREDKVYMSTSAASSGDSRLFRLSLNESSVTQDGWMDLTGVRQVTSLSEAPGSGSLYAVGLTFDPASLPDKFTNTDAIFTQPRWAMISPAGVNWTAGQTIPSQAISGGSDLALPLSAVFAGHAMDYDNDGDVDQDDVDLFESRASGPGIPRPSGCEEKDLDNDGDVDQVDFGILQRCFSGENVPANPDCMD